MTPKFQPQGELQHKLISSWGGNYLRVTHTRQNMFMLMSIQIGKKGTQKIIVSHLKLQDHSYCKALEKIECILRKAATRDLTSFNQFCI